MVYTLALIRVDDDGGGDDEGEDGDGDDNRGRALGVSSRRSGRGFANDHARSILYDLLEIAHSSSPFFSFDQWVDDVVQCGRGSQAFLKLKFPAAAATFAHGLADRGFIVAGKSLVFATVRQLGDFVEQRMDHLGGYQPARQ